jgi:hypothetical protein
MLIWLLLLWIPWLLAGWLLWDSAGLRQGLPVFVLFILLQVVFPIPLLRPRARRAAGRLLEWAGIVAAGFVGGFLGALAAGSLVVFTGRFAALIAAVGAATGAVVMGWTYATSARKQDSSARNDSLTGFLFAAFAVALAVYVLARLSLWTTVPAWLFRFPDNETVRGIWEWAGSGALLAALWAVGATFIAEAGRNMPAAGYGRVRRRL